MNTVHGRTAERRLIRDLLRRAQRGVGGVLLVEGEPGIGKSTLLQDAVGAAAGLGFSLAVGAADPLGQAIPFFAVRRALGEPFARLTTGSDERRQANAPMWWIGQMRDHLTERAAATPILVCVDDLQWSCAATLAAVRALTRDLRQHPVAWVLARSCAPHDDAGQLFDLLEKDGAGRVSLARLGQDAVTALVTDALGAPPDPGLLALAQEAAGNPALLADLAAGLREDFAVRIIDGQASLTGGQLPARLRRTALGRLDGLGPQARNLLVTASMLGPSFPLEDTAAMLGGTAAALLPAVEEVMTAGLLTAADDAFSFRHELLRRAVRDTIPPPGLRALHRQYGQLLLGRGGAAERAADHLLLAAHGGSPASLADLDTAVTRTLSSTPQTAADLAVRVLELTPAGGQDQLPRAVAAAEALAAAGRLEPAGRIARDTLAKPLPSAAEERLRCALSSVLCSSGRARDAAAEAELVLAKPQLPTAVRDAAITAHLQALAALRGEGAAPAIAPVLAAPDRFDGRAVVAALVADAALRWDRGQLDDGLELLRDAVRREARITLDARHLQPLLALAAALVYVRQLDQAEEILRIAESQPLDGTAAQAALRILRARVQLAAGELTQAADTAEEALAIAESLGAHGHSSAAHCVLGLIALRQGDLTSAALHVASDSVPGPHSAETYARAEVTMVRAQVSEARDGAAAALGHIRHMCAGLGSHPGLLLGNPDTAPWLTRTALDAGHGELAAAVAQAAQALASANAGYPAVDAAAAHSRGLAEQDTALLAEAAERHPDRWTRASAAEDLGVIHARRAEDRHAVGRLTEAIEGYQAVGAAADMARVRRRLRKLGVRRRHWTRSATRPEVGWESLTETEGAVAELVAQGLSNRDVAARMYVSVHTVAFYLRQIFRKLEIGSRVELARIVVERPGPAVETAGLADRAGRGAAAGHNAARSGQGEQMTVQLSHLDKLFFPGDGLTKGDLVSYYREMAPHILGYLRGRPLVLGRYPDGITGQRIVQKNVGAHFPDWVRRTEVAKQGGAVCHVLADKPDTLVYLANQGTIELHVFLSRVTALHQPDQLVFDLDPPSGDRFGDVCRHALHLRGVLEDELGLTSYVKTTGGKGVHVRVPLRPEEDFDAVRGFARDVGALLASRYPDELTLEQRKDQRGNRLYLDIMRNAYAQTVVAPYTVRARPGATVATPLQWNEIWDGGLSPRQFTVRSIAARLEASADPWAAMTRHRRGLAAARRRLASLSAAMA